MKINFQFSVAKCKSKACRFPFGHVEFDQFIERALVTIRAAASKEIHRSIKSDGACQGAKRSV
jgi:hypothetical protein